MSGAATLPVRVPAAVALSAGAAVASSEDTAVAPSGPQERP